MSQTSAVSTATLELDRVTVAYSGLKAIDDVTVELGRHPVTAVIGPNGAGKTTLLNVATGFVRPTTGAVRFGGTDLRRTRPHKLPRKGLVRTWQGARLFPSLTVADNLLVAAPNRRTSNETLERLHLSQFRDRAVGSLSLGDRLRVVFARALAAGPQILMLDEPFAGLERSAKQETSQIIKQMAIETGLRAILVEHDVPTVMSVADVIVVMQAGRVLTQGDPQSVITDPRVVECYFGEDLGQW